MDLKLLPHLSDEALAAQARERGVDPTGRGREALIEAIRAAAPAPRAHPEPRAEPEPPPPPAAPMAPPRRRLLGAARALLDRVI